MLVMCFFTISFSMVWNNVWWLPVTESLVEAWDKSLAEYFAEHCDFLVRVFSTTRQTRKIIDDTNKIRWKWWTQPTGMRKFKESA
jgi:hypothetical protein